MQVNLFRPAPELLVMYARYHRDRRNIATHLVGIPLIVMSLGSLLSMKLGPGGGIALIWLVHALSAVWYLTRGAWVLGLATVCVNAALIALALYLVEALPFAPHWQGVALFVIGWAFQFVGHFFEGRKPAFADDLAGLLVGPMFVVAEVMAAFGMLKPLMRTVSEQAGPVH